MVAADAPFHGEASIERLVLDRFLPYRLSVLTNVVSGSLARTYAERFGITIPEWRVMAVLGMGEPLASVQLSARTAMDKVQVSRAIARLTSRGLVERLTDAKDRRRATLRLSPAGETVYRQIIPPALSYEKKLTAVLTEHEAATLDRLITKLLAHARCVDGDGN